MRRVFASLLFVLAGATAGASRPSAALAQEPRAAADTVPPAVQPLRDTVAVAQRPRRRGSMVGYLDDATIGTRLRLRYEAAFRNEVPDRAEFFYAKCGCFRPVDPLALGPGPEVPLHVDFQQLYLTGEVAVTNDLSAFVHVPLRWIQPQFAESDPGSPEPEFGSEMGLSDVRVGAKYGLVAEEERAVTLQLQAYLASGDPLRGMGTNHNSIEPALLYYQRIAQRLALEAQGGIWIPFGRSTALPDFPDDQFAGAILFYGIGPSYELYRTERLQFAPVVELLAWQVLGGYQTPVTGWGSASGTNIVNLKLGARTSFGAGSIYLGYGRALTSESWYEEILRVEYRHNF